MVRHKFPFVPLNSIMSIEGGVVNDAAVTFADKEFPRGCLLFTGMGVPEPTPDPTLGIMTWDIEFGFLGNAIGRMECVYGPYRNVPAYQYGG